MQVHGRIELDWQGNCLVLHAYGPFNEEGVAAGMKEYRASLAST